METALLAKAVTDLQVSSYLLQAARDEEAEAAFGGEPSPPLAGRERGVATTGPAEPYLELLLHEGMPGPDQQERAARKPRNVEAARAELALQAGDTLTLISERAREIGGKALNGVIALGAGEVGRAVGVIGMNIAQLMGQAEKVTRLYNLFRDYLLKAYNALVALLGPRLIPLVGEQVRGWVEEIRSGERMDTWLEKLYQTRQSRDELHPLIRESNAPLKGFVNAIEQVSGLDAAFQKQTDLVDKILSGMKVLTLVPAAALPQGRLLLAAAYVSLCGYVILVGGDYVDARRLEPLDRVPGVRRVVVENLAGR
jgi:hypothetical protein